MSKNTFSAFRTCSQLHLVFPLDRTIPASTTESQRGKIKVSCIQCLCCITCNNCGLKLSYHASVLLLTFGGVRLHRSLPKIPWVKQCMSNIPGIFRLWSRTNTARLFSQFTMNCKSWLCSVHIESVCSLKSYLGQRSHHRSWWKCHRNQNNYFESGRGAMSYGPSYGTTLRAFQQLSHRSALRCSAKRLVSTISTSQSSGRHP